MKKRYLFLWLAPIMCLLFSCSEDAEPEFIPMNQNQPLPNNNPTEGEKFFTVFTLNSNVIYDYPIESSPTEPIVGRWKLNKVGVVYHIPTDTTFTFNEDPDDFMCGQSYLQFNSNGVSFQNYFKRTAGVCVTYSGLYNWIKINNQISIDEEFLPYDVIKSSQSELILMNNWDESDWGPMRIFYYMERI